MKTAEYLQQLNRHNPYKCRLLLHELQDQKTQQAIYQHCKHNLADWIDWTCIAADPDAPSGKRAFVLYPRQREMAVLFDAWNRADNPQIDTKVYEKSRRVGWTNTTLFCLLHAAMFWGHSALIATKDWVAADMLGDMHNSLFPRLRMALAYQPAFLLPEGFRLSECNRGIIRFGEKNNATIRAFPTASHTAANKLGRSGRVRFAFFDEAAFWDSAHLESAFGACAMTAKIRILASSACTESNHFFSRLVDGLVIPGVRGEWIPFESNPHNTPEYLQQLRANNTTELIDREVLGVRGASSLQIIQHFQAASFSG